MGDRATPAPGQDPSDGLFKDALVISNPHFEGRRQLGIRISLVTHALALTCLILLPILWPEDPPEQADLRVRLMYNPPPPPPPPLPKGSALVPKPEPAKPVTPDTKPDPTKFIAPETPKDEAKVQPEEKTPENQQAGSETGSESGLADGMEGGVEGGVVGGVLGGVLGGVIGGTGDGPVLDYDQGPRPIKQAKPSYPQEAFIKKIEGVVLIEVLIDANGQVARARVIQSIPLLDKAALETVYQWRFLPAMKKGRPVAIVAQMPVRFSIF